MKTIVEYLINNHIHTVNYHLWDRVEIDGVPCTVLGQGKNGNVVVLSDYYAITDTFYKDADVTYAGKNILDALNLNIAEMKTAKNHFGKNGWRLPHEGELHDYNLWGHFGQKGKNPPKFWVTVAKTRWGYYDYEMWQCYKVDDPEYHSYFLRFIKEIPG